MPWLMWTIISAIIGNFVIGIVGRLPRRLRETIGSRPPQPAAATRRDE